MKSEREKSLEVIKKESAVLYASGIKEEESFIVIAKEDDEKIFSFVNGSLVGVIELLCNGSVANPLFLKAMKIAVSMLEE